MSISKKALMQEIDKLRDDFFGMKISIAALESVVRKSCNHKFNSCDIKLEADRFSISPYFMKCSMCGILRYCSIEQKREIEEKEAIENLESFGYEVE